jgi:hypothetical protein
MHYSGPKDPGMKIIYLSRGFPPAVHGWFIACAAFLIIFSAGAQAQDLGEKIEVFSYLDTTSAGWAYKKSDYAFVVETKEYRIQWNAIEMKEPGKKKLLSVRRNCAIPFSEQVRIHQAILAEIFSKWTASEFGTISWGSFANSSDWSWNIPIAIASSRSSEYKAYRAKRPKAKNINDIFVQLANETMAYNDLRQIIRAFGIDIELSSVEKVFVSTAKELPFHATLNASGISAKEKVIYDVAFSYFKIK